MSKAYVPVVYQDLSESNFMAYMRIYAARFGQYAEPFPNPNGVPASDYAHTHEEFRAIAMALHYEERRRMDAQIARSMKNGGHF